MPKLIEISYEEHVALYGAGAWTQWDVLDSYGKRTLSNTKLLALSSVKGPPPHGLVVFFYYTRTHDDE